jgi:hypothetical protein
MFHTKIKLYAKTGLRHVSLWIKGKCPPKTALGHISTVGHNVVSSLDCPLHSLAGGRTLLVGRKMKTEIPT